MNGEPPELVLDTGEDRHAVTAHTFCWGGLCADGVYPPAIGDFLAVGAGGALDLEFDGREPDSVFLGITPGDTFPEGDYTASTSLESDLDAVTWNPGVPAGDYVLSVTARWGNGDDAAYVMGVVIP